MSAASQPPRVPSPIVRVAALLLIAAGVWARARDLDAVPLWVDEAESSVNALTILEHGVPVDHYLDQPIYENTLTEPWPGNPEYEFRDSSYSRNGLANYHGWLPFYAIAASFELAGIAPDVRDDPPVARHGVAEISRRTLVARSSAIVFSALFLFLIWRLGLALSGPELGLAALAVAAFSQRLVWLGQQARYYSPTLAFTAATALATWNAARRGRWSDHLLLALAAVLLFHSHSFSLGVMAVAALPLLPALLRRPGGPLKVATTAAIVVAGTVPWLVATGFLEHLGRVPRAWPLLELPRDFLLLRMASPVQLALLGFAVVAIATLALTRRRHPEPLAALVERARAPLAFLAIWAVAAIVCFPLAMPAVSYFPPRAVLVAVVPLVLGVGMVVALLLQWLAPRYAAVALLAGAAAYLAADGNFAAVPPKQVADDKTVVTTLDQVVDMLASCDFAPGTRIYSTPNDHLRFQYYTGLPVQSIAPVRRSFLEAAAGDVVIIESSDRYPSLPAARIEEIAASMEQPIPPEQAELWRDALVARHVRRDLEGQVVRAWPPLANATPLEQELLRSQTELTQKRVRQAVDAIPLMRGLPARDWGDWWKIYAYRFVDVESRTGEQLNYAELRRQSASLVLPSGTAIHIRSRAGNWPFSPVLLQRVERLCVLPLDRRS